MPDKPQLKLAIGDVEEVTLLQDKPLIGTNQNGEYYMYNVKHNGVEKVHFASGFAHERLQRYKSGAVVSIEHKPLSNGKSVYDVILLSQPESNEMSSSYASSSDTDQAIKWGMAFNNATRLVANISDITPRQKITLIEEIMPEMFKVACSMPNTSTTKEVAPEDDDTPF